MISAVSQSVASLRAGGSFAIIWKWYPRPPHQIPDPGNSTAYPLLLFFSEPGRDFLLPGTSREYLLSRRFLRR